MARSLTKLLEEYGLKKNMVPFVKDERSNLNAMTIALKLVMSCGTFGLEESFQGTSICYDGQESLQNLKYVCIDNLHKKIFLK